MKRGFSFYKSYPEAAMIVPLFFHSLNDATQYKRAADYRHQEVETQDKDD
ncbi:MAG: hypothetical protein WC716_11030 [Chitinophagaceae bacterium]